MMAAFAHSLLKVRHHLAPERAVEIAVGFVHGVHRRRRWSSSHSSRVVRRVGFVPFAWYRIAAGVALFGAMAAGWL